MLRGLMKKKSAVHAGTSGLMVVLLALGFPGMGLSLGTGSSDAEAPAGGALSVVTEPEGATVYFDGEAKGVTPVELQQLSSGDHRVTLVKEGYLENSRVVSLEGGETRTLDVDLTPSSEATRHTIQIRTEEGGAGGGGSKKWLYIAGAGGAAAAAIVLLSGGNKPPIAGTISVTPSGMGIASVTNFSFTSQGANDPDGDPLSYSWDFADGGSASGQTTTHTFTGNGVFPVTVTVSDGHGGSATNSTNVTVTDLTGTWVSQFSGVTRTWNLRQSGTSISGSYNHSTGGGGGTVSGNLSSPREIRVSVDHPRYAPWTFSGTVNSEITAITGRANGSGFENDEMTFRRQ